MRAGLAQAEAATAGNQRLVFNVCFNYGGRWDIAQAAARLAARGEAITEQSLDGAMALAHVPDPDLLIRTGGEQRMSNFLLWQAAYSELYFSDKLWPEFDAAALDEAWPITPHASGASARRSEQVTSRRPPRGRHDRRVLSMLKQRIITAVVLLAILLPALFWPSPVPLAVVTLLLLAAGAWEWGRLNGLGQAGSVAAAVACLALCGVSWSAGLAGAAHAGAVVGRRRRLGAGRGLAAARRGGGLAAHPAGSAARGRRAGPVAGLAGSGRRHG